MNFTKLSIAAAMLAFGLAGTANAASPDAAARDNELTKAAAMRHDHQRDAKQGAAAPYTPRTAARKPLHDHRQFK